jgi:hypothetical protein
MRAPALRDSRLACPPVEARITGQLQLSIDDLGAVLDEVMQLNLHHGRQPPASPPPTCTGWKGRDSPGPQGGLPSRFLNPDFTDAGIRGMWVQVKLPF